MVSTGRIVGMTILAWAVGLVTAGMLLWGILLVQALIEGGIGAEEVFTLLVTFVAGSFTFGALITAPLFLIALVSAIALRERLAISAGGTILGASLAAWFYGIVFQAVTGGGREVTAAGLLGSAGIAFAICALPVAAASAWFVRALRRRIAG